MSKTALFLHALLRTAVDEIRSSNISVFTFALYHDHASRAVSVCVDTQASSERLVRSSNKFSMEYFFEAVAEGDLEEASGWQANVGRSLSLGDFALVNVARQDIVGLAVNKQFYLQMARALIAFQDEIATLSQQPEQLLFACSGPDAEVAMVWSLP